MDKLPILFCTDCGRELKPIMWAEGSDGFLQHERFTGSPYKEFTVFYRCLKNGFFSNHKSFKDFEYAFRKELNSHYRLPESIKEYLKIYWGAGLVKLRNS